MAVEKVRKNNGWEELNHGITSGSFTKSLWGEDVTFYWTKMGRMVHLAAFKDFNSARSSYSQSSPTFTLPAELRPERTCEFVIMALINSNVWSSGTYYACLMHIFASSGEVFIRGNDTEMKKMRGIQITCTYIAAS